MSPPDANPVTFLDDDAAWDELRTHAVGRLAVSLGGEPEIFPVNFAVDGRSLVFRTAEGSKLLAATLGGVGALEVDRFDDSTGTSVIARGPLAEMEGAQALAQAEELPLRSWVGTVKSHYVRLDVTQISGRRFTFGDAPEDFHPLG
ncbi:pyridoxamine 5'-phosphate oxidase family protein [Propioniciclava soli]|uniref:Pyridoxamine 5'-phosphate oxidase family protein n=1 Tax=Propioniciclava soli TaxID=2775081 RepID=A0ABZ3CAF2_9ACTN|nr:pyridoxamine 5'-phosphate oxidase family protein [Propioniciclava soli]